MVLISVLKNYKNTRTCTCMKTFVEFFLHINKSKKMSKHGVP